MVSGSEESADGQVKLQVRVESRACPRVAEHSSGFSLIVSCAQREEGARLVGVLMPMAATGDVPFVKFCLWT